jgi:hypothetical protein
MDLDKLGRFISSVGFPITVAFYLLWRIDPLLRDLNISVIQLTILIQQLGSRVH